MGIAYNEMNAVALKRDDHRVIIHFDYDCFYAAVFEREDPALKLLPLAVQQKQIIVTCNYEARRRGLHKLQLVREAKEKCPDVIIVLGEDLTRFRNASKELYNFLRSLSWSNKVERLGFDEVFIDVTDMIEYNLALLNKNNLTASFFHLHRADPTLGFLYDASSLSGYTFPARTEYADIQDAEDPDNLWRRLCLGSHLAQHFRQLLEEEKGFTSTVGISTNKLLSKLVGNVNKPNRQTTLIPPYLPGRHLRSHVNDFIDDHDIGQIPGIGFKTAQKIRGHVLGRLAAHETGLVYGGTRENIKVSDVRLYKGMGPKLLGQILDGPGMPKDLPDKVWGLINGVDDSEVAKGRDVPQQISVEDSYIRLDELLAVEKELKMLAVSLLKRMRLDLTTYAADEVDGASLEEQEPPRFDINTHATLQWIAHPRTIRLSTRPRPPLNPDGTRSRTFARISKSGPVPAFIFSLNNSIDSLSEKLVIETLLPLFRKLHPEKSGWNLSLVNICVTNMAVTASDDKDSAGRDISLMFKRQDEVLKDWKVEDINMELSHDEPNTRRVTTFPDEHGEKRKNLPIRAAPYHGSEDEATATKESNLAEWDSEGDDDGMGEVCAVCGAIMPAFAMVAHERFHGVQH